MLNEIRIIKTLKSLIPMPLKLVIIRAMVAIQLIKSYFFPVNESFSSGKKIFVLLGTDYANLGDHALTLSQVQYLEKHFPDYQIIEIPVSKTLQSINSIKKDITDEDVITIKGGGNIGIEYFREELIRRVIITKFRNSKIVMFPQTVYFPDTFLGRLEFRNTIRTYRKHKNLSVFLRDQKSYDIMKDVLLKTYLVPDIVFSLEIPFNLTDPQNELALICMRDDAEGVYSETDKNNIKSIISKYYKEVMINDTVKDYAITMTNRLIELEKMFSSISRSAVVITDRLHGMIFACLLNRPCIVLNTYNHKLKGQYEWIKTCQGIYSIDYNQQAMIDCLNKIHSDNSITNNNDIINELRCKHEIIASIIKKDNTYE